MPIPEPSTYVPTLKKEQIAKELAAAYGVNDMTQGLSFEEIERMRRIIIEHDAAEKPVETFDLNNPPRKPYKFQKFPMLVYSGKQTTTVRSEDELADALENGWSQDASSFTDEGNNQLSAKLQNEANAVQDQIEEVQVRRRGRPAKNVDTSSAA